MKTPSPVYYSTYLGLDRLLSAQNPISTALGRPAHDEMLFIIIHQSYELWFKQILHEMDSVAKLLSNPKLLDQDMLLVVSRLRRVVEIERLLVDQVAVLETMTPMDFLDFRDLLAPASGFQSVQFRVIENRLGLRIRNEYGQQPYVDRLSEEDRNIVRQAEDAPSLLTLIGAWLERIPFLESKSFDFAVEYPRALEKMLEREEQMVRDNPLISEKEKSIGLARIQDSRREFELWFDPVKFEDLRTSGKKRLSYRATQAALFILSYRDEPALQLPFQILSALQDIDEGLTHWRYRHSLMVHRMIGTKLGTGGSSGYDYLKQSAEKHRVFVDISDLSAALLPRSILPALPKDLKNKLALIYSSQ